jgi:hypothetical protein
VAASVRVEAKSNGAEPVALRPVPYDLNGTWPTWEEFVPTAIRLATLPDDEGWSERPDVDGSRPARFMTGLKIAQRERQYPGVRVQQVSVRAYLAPPARLTEIASRAEYLEASGHPMRIESPGLGVEGGIYGALSQRERRQLEFIMPDERIALAAVLAAVGRPAAAFSEDGSWPCHPLVMRAAQRVGCTIVRRRLGEIPPHVRRHIRIVRYLAIPEAPCEKEGSET